MKFILQFFNQITSLSLGQIDIRETVQTGDHGSDGVPVAVELPPSAGDAGEQPDGEADARLDGRHGQGHSTTGPPERGQRQGRGEHTGRT